MPVGKISRVAVFGGTGFLGTAISRRLAAGNLTVRTVTRHPDDAREGGIESVYGDVRDETSVGLAMAGCDAVVNAVGLYVEKGAETFDAVHARGARAVARQAAASDIARLVHISGIGADRSSESPYVRARGEGEAMVREAFPQATILRPSVLFGPGDNFLNAIAAIARFSPVFPLFGRGRTRLQPVYVGDVAAAVRQALQVPDAPGRTYELGGPQVYSYRALVALVLDHIGRRRWLLPVPFRLWSVLAGVSSVLPSPPVTHDQIALMRRDNVVADAAFSFDDLKAAPTPLATLLPQYRF